MNLMLWLCLCRLKNQYIFNQRTYIHNLNLLTWISPFGSPSDFYISCLTISRKLISRNFSNPNISVLDECVRYTEAQSQNRQHSNANTILTKSTKQLIKVYSIKRTWFGIELLILICSLIITWFSRTLSIPF